MGNPTPVRNTSPFFIQKSSHAHLVQWLSVHLQGATLSRATTWVVIATAVTMLIPLVLYWLSGGLMVHDDLSDALRVDGDELTWVFYAGLIVLALRATKTLSWGRAIGVIAIFGGIFLLFAGLFLACILFARS